MDALTSLLFKREFDREYDRWSLSRAELAEVSPEVLYATIAEMIRNASDTGHQPANGATTRSTGPSG